MQQGSERDASWPDNDHHGLLPETCLVGLCYFAEPLNVLGLARQHDLHELARLPHGMATGLVAPLALGVEDREAVGKARGDLAVKEAHPLRLAHADPVADLAAKQELGDHLRLLRAAAGEG